MKTLVFAAIVLSASLGMTASAQVKSVAVATNQPPSATSVNQTGNTNRARVLGLESKSDPVGTIVSSGTVSSSARTDFNNHAQPARLRRANSGSAPIDSPKQAVANDSLEAAKPEPIKAEVVSPHATAATSSPAIGPGSTQLYRVGIRDVLDIRLTDHPSRNSTLFTVLEGGLLEYPFAGNPIMVTGMTPPEIAELLRQRIKIFENPAVAVTVRDYASHAVTVSGFVAAPGTKVLRREAVPLYTVLAEALILPEAARATINRQGRNPMVVDLKDATLSATLVVAGDLIKVSGMPAAPTEFFFIGGEINSPGQKAYHAGLTLTQAILASGGASATAGAKVKVSRQGTDGRLSTEEHNLRKIQSGKAPDPVLQNGDRVEVTTAN